MEPLVQLHSRQYPHATPESQKTHFDQPPNTTINAHDPNAESTLLPYTKANKFGQLFFNWLSING